MEQQIVIPPCQYLIKKGEKPHPGRANIFVYTPALARRVEEFEPFIGPLPPLTEKQLDSGKKPQLNEEQVQLRLRKLSIINAMDQLSDDEFTAAGLPKLDALKKLTEFDITSSERDYAWARHKRNKNRVPA